MKIKAVLVSLAAALCVSAAFPQERKEFAAGLSQHAIRQHSCL